VVPDAAGGPGMNRLDDIRAFLAQHNDGRVIGQLPGILGVPMSGAEAEFQRRLLAAGYSSSYLALLGLVATLTFDAGESFPGESLPGESFPGAESSPAADANCRDLGERHGYHRGLQTALACLVMHETGSNPRQAALLVAEHTETLIRCRWTHRPAKRDG
jgi:hypothetical protein